MYIQTLFSPTPLPGLRPGFRPSEARVGRTAIPTKMVRQ